MRIQQITLQFSLQSRETAGTLAPWTTHSWMDIFFILQSALSYARVPPWLQIL